MRKSCLVAGAALAMLGVLVSGAREARACGGCFVPPSESTVVNDHRMVLAVSQEQTVLWDQIQYTGDPKEFAWVLPVRRDTKVELSRDEWITSLDALTQPVVQAPFTMGSGGGEGDGCNGGCSSTDALGASSADRPSVQVVSQSVVGPYETVTLRSEDAQALQTWLRDHGYAIPTSMEPVIGAYTDLKLDFIALRLQPGHGVKAMKPVRIVTPGADATLPLRMVAAGVGANVGLTLYVIAEGRYRPQNFPEVTVDDAKLVWKSAENRSNYQELSLGTMAASPGGRGWLVEFAGRPVVGRDAGRREPVDGGSLYDLFYSQCSGTGFQPTPRDPLAPDPLNAEDASTDASTGEQDAAVDASSGETQSDAGSSGSSGSCENRPTACCSYDDLDVAIKGMNRGDVWVTRLRANLPVTALAEDLRLEAHPTQAQVSNLHQASPETGTTASIAPFRRGRSAGSAAMVMGAAFVVGRILRRRKGDADRASAR